MDFSKDPSLHSSVALSNQLGFSISEEPWDQRSDLHVSYNALSGNVAIEESGGLLERDSGQGYGAVSAVRRRHKFADGTERQMTLTTETDRSEQIALTWDDVKAKVPEKRSWFRSKTIPEINILKGVSGYVLPGTLLAIMGASGSGKTTLLNVLNHRNTEGLEITGDISVNGVPIGDNIKSLSAYVQQDDLFEGVLTVREHLWFHAMLKMDKCFTDKERQIRINQVIRELGLTKCQNTLIGVPGRIKCISGGERKRVAFASEILTNPALLFCDEPTSGLDSFMAENVVQTLRAMATTGKTIICTIHQPSSKVFALFDNLLLLAEGRVAYMGSATGASDFFLQAGYKCPEHFNPADFYVKTLAIMPNKINKCKDRVNQICDLFDKSPESALIQRTCSQITTLLTNGDIVSCLCEKEDYFYLWYSVHLFQYQARQAIEGLSPYKASYFRQFRYVMWRSWLMNTRVPSINITRFIINILVSIFVGWLFHGSSGDQLAVQNINGAMFFAMMTGTFTNAFSVVHVFPSILPLFYREHANGLYRVSILYLCKMLADLPVMLTIPIMNTLITYWLVGYKSTAAAFFTFMAVYIILTHVGMSFMYSISILFADVHTALSISNPAVVPIMLMSGFFLNDGSIPVYFIWIKYISWMHYSLEIMMINQWHNFGNLTCDLPTTNGTTTCFETGEDVIASMNFDPSNILQDFLMLAVLFVVLRFSGYIFLLYRAGCIKFLKAFSNK